MSGWFATLGVVAQMAFRNLFASRLKTIIVGGIIFFGGLLVVTGNSLLDSLVASMSRSVIGSVAGHIQVYNAKSKDSLEVMGRMMMGDPDIAQLDDFSAVRASLLKVPNVKSVVPMGISGALVTSGNTIDLALEKLRNAVKAQRDAKTDAEKARAQAQIAAEKGHVRQIVSVLQGDLKNAKAVLDEKAIDPADAQAVVRAASDQFWQDFDKDPFEGLEFLENRIASQAADADLLFLNYVGTDFQAFQKSFDRMKIVEGKMVPPGKRGFLFAKQVYEDQLKLKAARRLDKIKEGIDSQGETIATDPDLKRMVRENTAQVREILLQLDAQKTVDFRAKLQRELGSQETDVGKLLAAFFQTDDQNFHERYDFFYKELAPSLELYRVRIGDVLTIKAFTRSGYVQSVNVPVYGTFQFQGLEKSTLAGALNLMDMVSFRELYGFMSGEKLAEIQALQKESGAHDVSRENAESELFGKADAAEAAPAAKAPRHIEATTTPGVSRGEARSRRIAGRQAAARRGAQPGLPGRRGRAGGGAQRRCDRQGSEEDQGDDRGDRSAGDARRADAQGDRLAEGRRPHRPVRQRHPDGALRGDPDHLPHRAGHHQQRAGDGHPRAGQGDRHAARDRRPAALHPGDAGHRVDRRRRHLRRPRRPGWGR